jgi:hypothetical protein
MEINRDEVMREVGEIIKKERRALNKLNRENRRLGSGPQPNKKMLELMPDFSKLENL